MCQIITPKRRTVLHSRGYRWPQTAENKLLSITFAFESHLEDSPRTIDVRHDVWIMDYLVSGEIDVQTGNGMDRPRKPLTAHLYAPGTCYHERHYDSPLHVMSIGFTSGQQIGLQKWTGKRGGVVFRDDHKILAGLLTQIVDIATSHGLAGRWAAIGVFYRVVDAIYNSRMCDVEGVYVIEPEKRGAHQDFVARVNEFLRQNAHRKITLSDIAEYSNVSVSTLTHRYRNETGRSPLEAHGELRMEQIKHFLFMGHRLKTIARSLDFGDMYHLSTFFKRHEGVSPREFLKTIQPLQVD